MPISSDDPPSIPGVSVESETPSATAEEAPDRAEPMVPTSPDGDARPPRRRRRRRRRRPPLADASQPAASPDEFQSQEPAPAGETAQHERASADSDKTAPHRRRRRRRRPPREPSQEGASQEGVPQERASAIEQDRPPDLTTSPVDEAPARFEPSASVASEPPRPRRRRRHRPPHRTPSADQDFPGPNRSEAAAVAVEAPQYAPGAGERQRIGPRRRRRPGGPAEREARPQHRGPPHPRDENIRRGNAGGRSVERRDQGSDVRGRRDRGSRGRLPGRGPNAPQRKPEQKLYGLESIVDRGFEDVADDTDESGTRRVHWTIVKRTVADQKSGKPMSAAYVLQREGVEAEFPNLGAARAAVNKTIVHPEKLTLSKAEHVAAKSGR